MQIPDYKITRRLGKGSFGTVHLAYDPVSNEKVAIKEINVADHYRRQQAKNEIEILRYLATPQCHPNLLCLIGFYEHDRKLYIVTEYIKGKTLEEYRINFDTIISIILIPLTQALQYLHGKGIAHRDLKLANILVNDEQVVKIIDYGLSCSITSISDIKNCDPKRQVGTPYFMAPELWLEKVESLQALKKVDIYALGIIFFYLFMGDYPYPSESLDDIKSQVTNPNFAPDMVDTGDDRLDGLIMAMIAKNPRERPHLNQVLDILYSIENEL